MKTILWTSLVVLVGVYIGAPIVDPDLWWHITAGKWILAHKAVPTVDHWNMFGIGKPWVAYSWSNEVIFALIDRTWGIQGLLAAKLLLGVAISFVLAFVFSKLAKDWAFGALLGVIVTAASYSHFTLRPQSLVWILFALILLNADRVARDGMTWSTRLFFVAIMCVWANTHITTAIGLVAALVWAWHGSWRENVASSIQVAGVCFIGMLLTPYFGAELLTFFTKVSHPFSHSIITEFRPAVLSQFVTGFAVILTTVMFLFLHVQPQGVGRFRLFFTLGLLGGGLAVIKFLPFALIALAATIAVIWRKHKQAEELGNLAVGLKQLTELTNKLPVEGATFIVLAMLAVTAYDRWQTPLAESRVPKRAVDFIQEHSLPLPILNIFGDGGYLMYRFSDESGEPTDGFLAAVDGRTNVTDPEVMEKHNVAVVGAQSWEGYFEVVKPNTVLWRNEGPLTAILMQRDDWCRVYADGGEREGFVVFSKKTYVSSLVTQESSADSPVACF